MPAPCESEPAFEHPLVRASLPHANAVESARYRQQPRHALRTSGLPLLQGQRGIVELRISRKPRVTAAPSGGSRLWLHAGAQCRPRQCLHSRPQACRQPSQLVGPRRDLSGDRGSSVRRSGADGLAIRAQPPCTKADIPGGCGKRTSLTASSKPESRPTAIHTEGASCGHRVHPSVGPIERVSETRRRGRYPHHATELQQQTHSPAAPRICGRRKHPWPTRLLSYQGGSPCG